MDMLKAWCAYQENRYPVQINLLC